MINAPQVVHTEVQHTAFIHFDIPHEDIRKVIGPGRTELNRP